MTALDHYRERITEHLKTASRESLPTPLRQIDLLLAYRKYEDAAGLADDLARKDATIDALRLVTECFISILGNVNSADTLLPMIVSRLKESGYGNLADDLAMTGFAAALREGAG